MQGREVTVVKQLRYLVGRPFDQITSIYHLIVSRVTRQLDDVEDVNRNRLFHGKRLSHVFPGRSSGEFI